MDISRTALVQQPNKNPTQHSTFYHCIYFMNTLSFICALHQPLKSQKPTVIFSVLKLVSSVEEEKAELYVLPQTTHANTYTYIQHTNTQPMLNRMNDLPARHNTKINPTTTTNKQQQQQTKHATETKI